MQATSHLQVLQEFLAKLLINRRGHAAILTSENEYIYIHCIYTAHQLNSTHNDTETDCKPHTFYKYKQIFIFTWSCLRAKVTCKIAVPSVCSSSSLPPPLTAITLNIHIHTYQNTIIHTCEDMYIYTYVSKTQCIQYTT